MNGYVVCVCVCVSIFFSLFLSSKRDKVAFEIHGVREVNTYTTAATRHDNLFYFWENVYCI